MGAAGLGEVEGAAERPEGEQVTEDPALLLGAEQAGRPRLTEDREATRVGAAARSAPARSASVAYGPASRARRLGLRSGITSLRRASAERARAVVDRAAGRAPGMRRVEPVEQLAALGVEGRGGYSDVPEPGEPAPLRVRDRARARCAQLSMHADPRRRMRVVEVDPEDEPARQADDADQPERRGDAERADRPEVGDDLRDPAPPAAARRGAPRPAPPARLAAPGAATATRSSSAAPWWPTSCTSDEAIPWPTIRSRGTRMIATGFAPPPGQPGPRAPDRGAGPAIEVAETSRRLERPPGGASASAATTSSPDEPDADLALAALREGVREQVEVRQHVVEAQRGRA